MSGYIKQYVQLNYIIKQDTHIHVAYSRSNSFQIFFSRATSDPLASTIYKYINIYKANI